MVTIIILNYRRPDLTINCINSLQIIDTPYNLVVVDNDLESASLKKQVENLGCHYVSTQSNIGYARGNNFGVRWAHENKLLGNYLCILNNDTILTKNDFFNTLIKQLETDKEVGLVGPKVINAFNDKRQGPYFKKFFLFEMIKLILPILIFLEKIVERDWFNIKNTQKAYRLIGAVLLFKSDAFLKIKGFDENTFLGAEEEIIAERLNSNGFTTIYTNATNILHYDGSTKKKTLTIKNDINYNLQSLKYYYKEYRKYSDLQIKIIVFTYQLEKEIKSRLKSIVK